MIVNAELYKFNVKMALKGSFKIKRTFIIYILTFIHGLMIIVLSLDKTMNALDKNLDQAEKF